MLFIAVVLIMIIHGVNGQISGNMETSNRIIDPAIEDQVELTFNINNDGLPIVNVMVNVIREKGGVITIIYQEQIPILIDSIQGEATDKIIVDEGDRNNDIITYKLVLIENADETTLSQKGVTLKTPSFSLVKVNSCHHRGGVVTIDIELMNTGSQNIPHFVYYIIDENWMNILKYRYTDTDSGNGIHIIVDDNSYKETFINSNISIVLPINGHRGDYGGDNGWISKDIPYIPLLEEQNNNSILIIGLSIIAIITITYLFIRQIRN